MMYLLLLVSMLSTPILTLLSEPLVNLDRFLLRYSVFRHLVRDN